MANWYLPNSISALATAFQSTVINMWNKVWMWNSFVTQTSREHPRLTEDCACAPRLHSHSENLFLVNFPRKDKKVNWCFSPSGINRKRCTPATSSLDTPSSKNMFSWQPSAYSRTCAEMVSSYKVYGCCCTSNGTLKLPFTAFLDAETLLTASEYLYQLCITNVCRPCRIF